VRLALRLGLIARDRKQTSEALDAMQQASEFARAAGANRILAGIAMERASVLRVVGRRSDAEAALREGVTAPRKMGERLLLPRLLAQLADLRLASGDSQQAAELLREADDILEGLLTNASSPRYFLN
jgi:tetratricopeptide (TPR) repeat protein